MRVVVFDAFGTLVEIGNRLSPYHQLIRWMRNNGHRTRPDDASRIMSHPLDLAATARLFGMTPPADLLANWEADLRAELSSIRLFPDVQLAMVRLREAGCRLAVCSNLAAPYGTSVKTLLPSLDAYVWSFEVGAVKPEPKIYDHLIDQLQCEASDVLFVGDTPSSDVEGPQAFGMAAKLIDRNKGQSLADILSIAAKACAR